MKNQVAKIIQAMIRYNEADPRRIQHALKVYAFAKNIGELEGLTENQLEVIEIASVLHDIGIKNSEAKYGSSSGKYQELEGPPVARGILLQVGIAEEVIQRVCFLIGHHHTYHEICGDDYQILVEADFLVNIGEDNMTPQQAQEVLQKVFKTKTAKEYLSKMYLQSEQTNQE